MAILYLEIDRTDDARRWAETTGMDVTDYGPLFDRQLHSGTDEELLLQEVRDQAAMYDGKVTIRRASGEEVR